MTNLEQRRELCGMRVKLNGKEATIRGARNAFAVIAQWPVGESFEMAWDQVASVIENNGGKFFCFQSEDHAKAVAWEIMDGLLAKLGYIPKGRELNVLVQENCGFKGRQSKPIYRHIVEQIELRKALYS